MTTAMIETTGLGKDYGELVAVEALTLTVEKGEIFGLLGPNGAGKTTAISMLCGVLEPSRGTARVAGHDIAAAPFPARRALGLVPQEIALYEELSARQNLAFFASLYGLTGKRRDQRVAFALDVAGLTDRANDLVARFSGGMKRRLNLAVGLLHEPALLVLDEPTVGVDPHSRHHLLETIRGLQKDHGITVLYTSHYMEEVQALCRRVAIMDHGKVIAEDTIAALLEHHAGGMVEIRFTGERARLAEILAGRGFAESEVILDDGHARFPASESLGAILAAVEAGGLALCAVHTHEPDLEAVFLTLTGKRLRDT